MSSDYWTLKTINGKTLPISQKSIEMFIRASLIQQMFFTDNPSQPSFRFNLTPMSLSNNLVSFTLNLEDQLYEIAPTSRKTMSFTWPGKKIEKTSIVFNPANKNPVDITKTGFWSWFRLLDTATIQPTRNAKIYTITFKSGIYQAKFQVAADNLINPFIPSIINKFRCPNKL